MTGKTGWGLLLFFGGGPAMAILNSVIVSLTGGLALLCAIPLWFFLAYEQARSGSSEW